MVKPKQTSEEKLGILHKLVLDSNIFFGSKELEKLAEKAGFRAMQAKDAVKMLLDENLVQCDKVACTSVFWALKSQAHAQQEAELRTLREQKAKLLEAQESLEAVESPNEATTDADERLNQVAGLEMRLRKLDDEIGARKSCSPKRFQQLTEEIAFARGAIERWTDNIAIIRQFTRSRLGIPEDLIDRLLELPQGWDSVDVGLEISEPPC